MTSNETAPVAAPVPSTILQVGALKPNVFQAVAKAAKACKVAGLDARNEFDKYDYRSIRGVMDAVHNALADAGVTVVLHEMLDLQRTSVKNAKGGDEVLITYTGVFRVYGPAGDWFETVHYCEGLDRRDKAGNKASSAGYKEVLQKLMTLPFGHDEVEQDSDDRGAIQPLQRQKGQRKAIDNATLMKNTGRFPYTSARGVLRRDADMKKWVEIPVDSLDLEEAVALGKARKQHAEEFRKAGDADKMMDADRDLALLRERVAQLKSDESLRRSGDDEYSADRAKADAEGPGEDDADVPAGAGPDSATSDEPASNQASANDAEGAPTVCGYAVHLGMVLEPEKARVTQALDAGELAHLSWLDMAEVLAMVVHPLNAPLFNPADAVDVHRFNLAGAPVFTGEWLAKAWLPSHEAAKGVRRRDARRLLRQAIHFLDLRGREAAQAIPDFKRVPLSPPQVEGLRAYLGAIEKASGQQK